MANLVEAHAAAVKPSLASVDARRPKRWPSRRRPQAEHGEGRRRRAAAAEGRGAGRGDDAGRAGAGRAAGPAIIDDQFLEIAQSLERGMWIEFEADDGQLAFAKLAWVSPLRGTYLFTNRQGQKALSMTAEELAERFRADRARLVEAEPLIDQAFTSMMASLGKAGGSDGRVAPSRRRSDADSVHGHARQRPAGARDDDRRARHRRRDPLRQAAGQAPRRT